MSDARDDEGIGAGAGVGGAAPGASGAAGGGSAADAAGAGVSEFAAGVSDAVAGGSAQDDPDAAHGDPGAGGLSARDIAVLDIAGRSWAGPGPREKAVRERLGISPTAYFQLLNALLDDPRALRHAPVTVNRLRADRERRRERR